MQQTALYHDASSTMLHSLQTEWTVVWIQCLEIVWTLCSPWTKKVKSYFISPQYTSSFFFRSVDMATCILAVCKGFLTIQQLLSRSSLSDLPGADHWICVSDHCLNRLNSTLLFFLNTSLVQFYHFKACAAYYFLHLFTCFPSQSNV